MFGTGMRFIVIYMRPIRALGPGARFSKVPRYELRRVREFLVSVQQPRRSQTGLSSLSGRSHVTQKKKCMEADTNSCQSEFVPVSCKYPLIQLEVFT